MSLKLVARLVTRRVLRSLVAMRLSGEKRDIVALGCDSVCLSVVDLEGVRRRLCIVLLLERPVSAIVSV